MQFGTNDNNLMERGMSPKDLQCRLATMMAVVLVLSLGACGANKPTKEEQEEAAAAAKATFACQWNGEKLILRFEPGEVRMLTSTAERITLYQIPSASGVRYSNASLELRGKGTDLTLIENGTPVLLVDCQQYVPPAPPAS